MESCKCLILKGKKRLSTAKFQNSSSEQGRGAVWSISVSEARMASATQRAIRSHRSGCKKHSPNFPLPLELLEFWNFYFFYSSISLISFIFLVFFLIPTRFQFPVPVPVELDTSKLNPAKANTILPPTHDHPSCSAEALPKKVPQLSSFNPLFVVY